NQHELELPIHDTNLHGAVSCAVQRHHPGKLIGRAAGRRGTHRNTGNATPQPRRASAGYACGSPMDDIEPAALSPRALRAIARIAVARVGVAVGVAAYLRARAPQPYSGPPPPPTSQPIPVSMDWRTGAQGWVVVHDAGGPESVLFRTSSAGARWERQFSI